MLSLPIPPELLDLVMGYLHDDQASLLACGLVPGLVQSSRYQLFAELSIRARTSSLFNLIDLLRSPLNTIAPYTHRLVFDDMAKLVYNHGVSDVVRALRIIPRLAPFLPRIRAARFCNTDFDRVPSEILGQLIYSLRGFADIELRGVHFSRFSEVVDVLCAFSELKRASLDRVVWTHGGCMATKLRRPLPHVEWYIGEVGCDGDAKDLAGWLGSQTHDPIIRSLYVGSRSRRLLHRSSSYIRDLSVDLSSLHGNFLRLTFYQQPILNPFSDSSPADIQLQSCLSLRKLYITNIILLPGDQRDSSLLRHLLLQIRSDMLQHLVLELALPRRWDVTQLEGLDFREIGRIVARPQYRSLRTISIVVHRPLDARRMTRYVLECMPMQRDMLHFLVQR